MILRPPALIDGGLVDTGNVGARQVLDDSPPVTRTSFLPQAPKYTPPPPLPLVDVAFLPSPIRPVIIEKDTSSTSSTVNSTVPSEGTHGSGPAIVEAAARSIESPAAVVSDGSPQQLPTVTVEGKPTGKTSIPWVPILIVLAVTIAIVVAVKVFGKRG